MAVDKNGKKLPSGIRQRANGSYEVRVSRNGKSYSAYAKTITEAKKKKAELEFKLDNNGIIENKKITYGEWFTQWMENYKKNSVKKGTFNTYKYYYDSIIKEEFKNRKLSSIKGIDLQRFFNKLLAKNYSDSSLRLVKAILGSSLKQAYKDEIISRNPMDAVTLPKNKEVTKKEKIALTREQQTLFMEFAKDSYLYNYFAVSLRSGMRSGEIRGLKLGDIDKENGVIHVRRTLKYINKQGFFEDTPKTKSSLRDIPLTSDLIALLEDQKNFWGFKIEKIDRYIFCNEMGEALSLMKVRREIDRIIKEIRSAGHEDFPHFSSHTFRHTFATRAIEAGMPPQVLKTILGHSSLAMTMDLYSHVLPDTKSQEMEKIASAF